MKSVLLFAGFCAGLSTANIVFNKVQPACDYSMIGFNGCLPSQRCTENNTCEAAVEQHLHPLSFRRYTTSSLDQRDGPFSIDGTCGPNHGNNICDPDSTAYTGTCCSQHGWCGNTPAHCGTGCVSGCTLITKDVAVDTAPRDDGRCGKDFDGATCDPNGRFGGCCSEYRYCGRTTDHCLVEIGCQSGCMDDPAPATPSSGSPADGSPSGETAATTTGEPVLPIPSTTANVPAATGAVTTDGSCGASNGNTVCGDWYQGSCCSMYGFCGNTTTHCGDGCQSGPCLNGAGVAAPGPSPAPANPKLGAFNIVGQSGVPAMHAGLLPNGRVVFLDKVENYTQLTLPNGYYAYSSEYDPVSNQVAPLTYKTNAFCSGGISLADGKLVSLGGNAPLDFVDPTVGDGFSAIRYLTRSASDPSFNGQDWNEPGNKLSSARWYASAQIMSDGTIFVASGSLNGLDPTVNANNNPTYEILNRQGISNGISVPMAILVKAQPYYMYPFIHLLRDGSLFVFVSKSSELFNVATGTTIRTFADLPGDYRTYPNTGGSVLLPLSSANDWEPDIMICGGGAYQDITSPTDPSCGRIQPLSANAKWEMDSMPEGRGMVEGTLLPDGTVVWVNGCNRGSQGFNLATNPTFEALIYDPTKPLGQRFTTGGSTNIPRLYHSVALLLLDGTLMIAGSNPNEQPLLTASDQYPFITDFRVEIYTPPYLQGDNANRRPTNVVLRSANSALKADGSQYTVTFTVPGGAQNVKVALYYGGFVTHSVHMGHRMAFLDTTGWAPGATEQTMTVTMPPSSNIVPPGPYVLYVVVDGVPSIGQFVMVE